METRIIAETFPPGEFIKDELEARGWTQGDLAKIMGRQDSVISAIVNGKRSISHEIAAELGAAFDTSAEVWMNAQTTFDLYSKREQENSVSRKAKIFGMAPVKDMIRRGWIKASEDLDTLETELKNFLDEPIGAVSFHKSDSSPLTPAQQAWLCGARKMAKGVQAAKFSQSIFSRALGTLKQLLMNPEDVRHVARTLAEGGVRFLIVEALPHTKIDGACFWLDEFSPVIVLTIRFNRMDNFWYILTHECGHVKNEDGIDGDILDLNLVGDEATPFDDKSDIEKRADIFATDFLVAPSEMENFVRRVRPLFSKQKIRGFAMRIGVHPAIVLGQLQHRKEVDWSHSREMLVKVRDIAISTTLTDGFGHVVPIGGGR